MTFEVRDYYDFVRLLYQHPEWQEELGNLLIAREIRELPQLVYELAEAQKRAEERLSGVEERVARLETVVTELAEAQKRSEERLTRLETAVAELAEAQKRTEQRVEELAEAQKRAEERLSGVEERVARLETAVAELTEAQKRTEQRVNELAGEVRATRSEVGKLSNLFGATLEEEAASVLKAVLRRKGYRLLSEEASLAWNGEVDVILKVETPEGRRLSVVVESKARLSEGDVNDWHQRIKSEGWQKRLQAAGYPAPYLFYFYAIRADSGAQSALDDKGIGLLKSEGEIIPPRAEFGG